MTQAQGTTGRLLADRYRLGEVLGRGGMGTVWRASDETLGRTVAVKELRFPGDVDDEEKRRLITRTLREAKAIARIRSTGAVTVFDVVEEDDRPWIVMELVESRSLSDVIRDEGPLTPHRAAEVGLAVLDVLRAAHREGILHRDVKPSNVLIADDGRVVLTDFGIAQVEGDPSVTSTGMLVGAPSYISPERARGNKPGPASDLWSLGVLLYAAVEGHPPYDKGSAIATLTAVMTEPVETPHNAGPLAEAIYGLLRKDPQQRLAEPEVRKILAGIVHAPQEPAPAPTATMPLPPPRDDERLDNALRAVRNESARLDGAAAATPQPTRQDDAPTPPPPAVRRPLVETVGRRRLAIIAGAVLAVLIVVAVILLAVNSGGGGGGHKGATTPSPTPKQTHATTSPSSRQSTTTAPAGSGGKGDKGDKGKGPGKKKGKGKGKGDKAGAIPDGFHSYTNRQFHFTMALPEGWKQIGTAGQSSGVILGTSTHGPRVQVDFTGSPGTDAAAAWRAEEPAVQQQSPGYHRISIRSVSYRDYSTVADWEFTRSPGGKPEHVLNRGFRVNSHSGYAIMFTAPAGEWNSAANVHARQVFFETFEPA
jgi:eukaryotic-like serine/threonine-protein kinase